VYLLLSCGSTKLRGNSPLFQHKLVLSELNKDAFPEFSYNERKATGYGGCNSITGTFNAEGNAFSFSL
jgi:heat shock protein HslJ